MRRFRSEEMGELAYVWRDLQAKIGLQRRGRLRGRLRGCLRGTNGPRPASMGASPAWKGLEALESRVLFSVVYDLAELPVLEGHDRNFAFDINNSGVVVGASADT